MATITTTTTTAVGIATAHCSMLSVHCSLLLLLQLPLMVVTLSVINKNDCVASLFVGVFVFVQQYEFVTITLNLLVNEFHTKLSAIFFCLRFFPIVF